MYCQLYCKLYCQPSYPPEQVLQRHLLLLLPRACRLCRLRRLLLCRLQRSHLLGRRRHRLGLRRIGSPAAKEAARHAGRHGFEQLRLPPFQLRQPCAAGCLLCGRRRRGVAACVPGGAACSQPEESRSIGE